MQTVQVKIWYRQDTSNLRGLCIVPGNDSPAANDRKPQVPCKNSFCQTSPVFGQVAFFAIRVAQLVLASFPERLRQALCFALVEGGCITKVVARFIALNREPEGSLSDNIHPTLLLNPVE